MSKNSIYAKLPLTEDQFKLFRSLATTARNEAFKKWNAAVVAGEKAFYSAKVDEWDALIAEKFNTVLAADTAQDANPDDYPKED